MKVQLDNAVIRPMMRRMRHARLWLLLIGTASVIAQAIAAGAVLWRGTVRKAG